MNKKIYFILVIVLLAGNYFSLFPQNKSLYVDNDNERLTRFEKEIEQLRSVLKIPGMSAAIVKDQKLLWAKGFGFSDVENEVPVTPETPFEIASLTKTITATLLMQLVEQDKVSLDDSMSKYSDSYKDDTIKVRQVLTHTSEGATPGEGFSYNGDLFANLDNVIKKSSAKRFRLLISENILDKLNTTDTSPGIDVVDNPYNLNITSVLDKKDGKTQFQVK